MELNIYFKNVGQGDSIIIDWIDDTENKKFGLIDCNILNDGVNSILKHIAGIKEIEFIILTHPHCDHFSGFPYLLDYLKNNNVIVNNFYYTSHYDPRRMEVLFNNLSKEEKIEFLQDPVNKPEHKKMLKYLYGELINQFNLKGKGFIKRTHVINNDYSIFLNNNITIKFLSPYSHSEIDDFFLSAFSKGLESSLNMENKPEYNYFSSFLQIFDKDKKWQILLCSDVTKKTLKRIKENEYEFNNLKKFKLIATQIPHHGSLENHLEEFWDEIPNIKNADVVISVGKKYGHPNVKVMNYFMKNAKSVHATNFVGGYSIYYSNSERIFFQYMSSPGIKKPIASNKKIPICCEKRIKVNTSNGYSEIINML